MAGCSKCGSPVSGARCGFCGNPVAAAVPMPAPTPAPTSMPVAPSPPTPFAAPTPAALPVVVPVAAATSGARASSIRCSIRRTQPHQPIDPPTNGWKVLTWLCLIVGFLPLGIAALAVVASIWLSVVMLRWVFGVRGSGASSGLLGFLVARGASSHGSGDSRLPVYVHEVDTGSTAMLIKQVGDFSVGAVMVGHDIDAHVTWNRGECLLRSGYNHSTGTPLALPGNPWKIGFVLTLLALGAFWFGIAPQLQGAGLVR